MNEGMNGTAVPLRVLLLSVCGLGGCVKRLGVAGGGLNLFSD